MTDLNLENGICQYKLRVQYLDNETYSDNETHETITIQPEPGVIRYEDQCTQDFTLYWTSDNSSILYAPVGTTFFNQRSGMFFTVKEDKDGKINIYTVDDGEEQWLLESVHEDTQIIISCSIEADEEEGFQYMYIDLSCHKQDNSYGEDWLTFNETGEALKTELIHAIVQSMNLKIIRNDGKDDQDWNIGHPLMKMNPWENKVDKTIKRPLTFYYYGMKTSDYNTPENFHKDGTPIIPEELFKTNPHNGDIDTYSKVLLLPERYDYAQNTIENYLKRYKLHLWTIKDDSYFYIAMNPIKDVNSKEFPMDELFGDNFHVYIFTAGKD